MSWGTPSFSIAQDFWSRSSLGVCRVRNKKMHSYALGIVLPTRNSSASRYQCFNNSTPVEAPQVCIGWLSALYCVLCYISYLMWENYLFIFLIWNQEFGRLGGGNCIWYVGIMQMICGKRANYDGLKIATHSLPLFFHVVESSYLPLGSWLPMTALTSTAEQKWLFPKPGH